MYSLDSIMKIFKYAKDLNATDIHFAAGTVPAVRIEGQLTYMSSDKILPADTENIINDILNTEQKSLLKASNYLSIPVVLKEIGRLRANIFMQRGSFSINFKLLDRLLKTPEELMIPPVVMDLHKKKSGLVLVCGSSNSGKATTMAAIIKKISETRQCHIITVEDPIKYLCKHDKAIVNQKEIGIDVKDYIDGIHSAMIQDPDVIMVSFCGNPDMFSAVLSAAVNGHLVITSLQTFGAVETLEYILGMYPADRRNHIKMQLSNVLEAIVSQRLIPSKDNKSNYLGTEVMLAGNAVKKLILENKIHQIPALLGMSKSLGMITFKDSVEDLYSKGLISKESVLSFLSEIS